jgi:hypothetical protein
VTERSGVEANVSPDQLSEILDGQVGAEYSLIVPGSLVFDADGSAEFLAIPKEGHSLALCHGTPFRVKYTPAP